MEKGLTRVKEKIEDGMLIGSIYDQIMKHTRYNYYKLSPLYNELTAHKHRMLYYKRLRKQYLSKCTEECYWEKLEKNKNKDVIWFSWLQGIDNAPLIVKRCLESIKEEFPDKEIRLVDLNNVFDYITLPDHIMNKWKKGIIGYAHLSDMIRLELLIKYGGYWIDSTVLCTDGTELRMVEDYSLFMYSFFYFDFNPEIMEYNNWLIYSETNNNILCLIREILYSYWKDYNRAINYFIFHIITTIAMEYYEAEAALIPTVSQVPAHILAKYIFDEFEQNKYDLLLKTTGIHKLSTRFDQDMLTKKGTFYDVIINHGKNKGRIDGRAAD